ncbi:MAG: PQQ-dependent sugar dehydrogenase [Castellaniella sp.]|nr:MAG: PQQ-dependent sugar dehydrogenase [Castellaniella sp.]
MVLLWQSLATPSLAAAGRQPISQPASCIENAGPLPASHPLPFRAQRVATFEYPWALAFLPDARLLVTEKPGRMFLVTQDGHKTEINGIPKVYYQGQNGLLDVAIAPGFARDAAIYFTYVQPEVRGGGSLVLARARLNPDDPHPRLQQLTTIWRQTPPSTGGQPGGIIAFAPDGQHLFLSVGDRQEPDTAQDPNLARGKILHMNLDGSTPADNPKARQGGIRALTWSTGHRNPYGLAFAPDGQLWEHEMGPRGGDELNRIQRDGNYGWPLVSYGDQYSGKPIARPPSRPEFLEPSIYWTPVIAPAGMVFYSGALFPAWRGSALIGGLQSRGLVRVVFADDGSARQADRWTLGQRIRNVAVAPDGAVWTIGDQAQGALMRLTPR